MSTDLEKITERVRIAKEAFDGLQHAANQDRKLSKDKHMNGHYTKALDELNRVISSETALLERAQARA